MGFRTAPRLALLGMLALAGTAAAEEKSFTIELNDAVDIGGGCRLVYVATNNTGVALKKASYDVFTFKSDGKVGQSLVFQFGAFPIGKTKVVQFDLAGQTCAGISRLLVNDVTECEADGASPAICMDALKTTTRTAIGFGL